MKNGKEMKVKEEQGKTTVKNQIWASTRDIGVSPESREWSTRYWINAEFKEAIEFKNKSYINENYRPMCVRRLNELRGMILYMYSIKDIDKYVYEKLSKLTYLIERKIYK